MDSEPDDDIVGPSKHHELFCDPENPKTMVMLKNIQLMRYFNQQNTYDDDNGQQVCKIFPNYYILNDLEVAHSQKRALYCMLQQQTCPQIMISQFCELAKVCFPDRQDRIKEFQYDISAPSFNPVAGILRQYTDQSFFYRLLNRLLRAGKDCTQIYYVQHFVKLLSKAITTVHRRQRAIQQQEVSGHFKCYRGAYFSEDEIQKLKKNAGNHIETLGFLSTSVDESLAKTFIINALLEIEVPNMPMDDQLNRGYAYLTPQYSRKNYQREVLFNVLSSFKIKSVQFVQNYNKKYWLIKLEYGATYQLMHRHKYNKQKPRGGLSTFEEEEVMSILKHQHMFKICNLQQHCLLHENAGDEYIWMLKAKIDMCQGNPMHSIMGKGYEQILYNYLIGNKACAGKEKQFRKQIQQRIDREIKQSPTNQPLHVGLSNLLKIFQITAQHFLGGRFRECIESAKMWQERKQLLTSNSQYHWWAIPQTKQLLEQIQLRVLTYQSLAKMTMYDEAKDVQKLKQEMQRMQPLKQQLRSNDRVRSEYQMLNQRELNYGMRYGLMSHEDIAQKMYETTMYCKGIRKDENGDFIIRLIEMNKQANQYLKNRQWKEAVRVCVEFRDQKWKGKEEEDSGCFSAIIQHLNKKTSLVQKLQLLQVALIPKHPKNSRFFKMATDSWMFYKNNQRQAEIKYVQAIALSQLVYLSPVLYLQMLLQIAEEVQKHSEKTSYCCITHECLVVNTLRKLGRYQEANLRFCKLKQTIRKGKNPEYYEVLRLGRFQNKQHGTRWQSKR